MAKQSVEFRALLADAMAHFQAGRPAEAERAYRAALAIAPRDPAVTHNLGAAIAAQGRHRDALGCFDEALAADSDFVSAHYNKAVALMALGEAPGAIKSFSRAAALEPEHYKAHRALGFLWLSQGERGGRLIISRAPTSFAAVTTAPPSR
jgi:tetratricopeptide (TPR) repeat protein